MPEELLPGTLTRVFARVATGGDVRARTALGKLARVVKSRAKDNLRQTTHRYGTPTPAREGGPPSLISGALRRCVTHTPILAAGAGSWVTKVGTGVGFYATYQDGLGTLTSRTPTSKVGYYLEQGLLRNGAAYPWLKPAYLWGITSAAPAIWRDSFRGRW